MFCHKGPETPADEFKLGKDALRCDEAEARQRGVDVGELGIRRFLKFSVWTKPTIR